MSKILGFIMQAITASVIFVGMATLFAVSFVEIFRH